MKFKHGQFSKALQAKLDEEKLTFREAADRCQISHRTLYRCVMEKAMPDLMLITYAKLCKWLSVPLDTYIQQ